MKKERMPRISLCMIVKNEEKKLARALSWGKDVLWEKVIVDTGSTDRTVELAESLGARVCHFTWIDDFAAARNFALEQARGEWILTLDADEYPAPKAEEYLLSLAKRLEEGNYDGVHAGILELDNQGNIMTRSSRIRLFRNTPQLRYRRRIHEQLGFTDGREMRLANVDEKVAFFHDGYVGEAQAAKQRSGRNLRLLKQELADHLGDYEIMGYLGDEYIGYGDEKQARQWYRRSVEHMPEKLPPSDPRSAWTFSSLIAMYTAEGNQEQAKQMYERAVRLQPEDADFDYVMGMYHVKAGHWEEGVRYLSQGLSKLERFGAANCSMRISADLTGVYGNLALCFLKSGRRQEAVQTTVAVLQVTPYDMKALFLLLQAFYEDGGIAANSQPYQDSVMEFLGKLYDLPVLKNRLFIARAAREAGWESLAAQMERGMIQ